MWLYAFGIALAILLLLCKIESRLQYTARVVFLYLWFGILATVTFPVGLIRPFNPSNHQVLSATVPYIVEYVFGITVDVRNKDYSTIQGPFVLLLNHQSTLDAFIMMYIWPSRCATIMKRELMFIPPFGLTAWLFGSIFVDRSNRNNAASTMKYAASEVINRNVSICMFPEGTRNRDGHLLPFKKGAFNLAVEGQVPLVPAAISSYRNFYSKKENKFTDGKVIISVLPAVPTVGKVLADVPDLADSIRNQMVDVYEKISAEVGSSKLS